MIETGSTGTVSAPRANPTRSTVSTIKPTVIAHDLHPEYLSTKYAMETVGAAKVPVQHHHAHIASCTAEHGLEGPALALVFDGTGYGPDGTLWIGHGDAGEDGI